MKYSFLNELTVFLNTLYSHGGYSGNRNYGSNNMADAQGAKNRHVYFSIKTAFNKMI